jgi:hypothetical protein
VRHLATHPDQTYREEQQDCRRDEECGRETDPVTQRQSYWNNTTHGGQWRCGSNDEKGDGGNA